MVLPSNDSAASEDLSSVASFTTDRLVAILAIILVGIITGFAAGMFGIGGALLSTPLLFEIAGLPWEFALATPLPATIPAAIGGTFVYWREGYLRLDVAFKVLIVGLPASPLGAWLVRFVAGEVMMILTGAVLLYSALAFLRKRLDTEIEGTSGETEPAAPPASMILGIGALAGLMSGFLAIGGGMVMVPAFVFLLRMPTKQALATSLLCVAGLAVPGSIMHHISGYIDWQAALILMASVMPVSALGARVASRMRSRRLELIYAIGTLIFALVFIARQL